MFRDEFTTKRALAGVGRPLPAEEMAGESSEGECLCVLQVMRYPFYVSFRCHDE